MTPTLTLVSDSTATWKRQARPVEVIICQVGARYAWVLRLLEEKTVVEEGTERSFRLAALNAELAEFRHTSTDWAKAW